MRKGFIIVFLVIVLLLSGCFDIQFGNSVKGNWTRVMFKYIYISPDTSYESSDRYYPEVDQYRFASMYTFTDQEAIYYSGRSDNSFLTDTVQISFSADSLYLLTDDAEFSYYFSDDKELVLRQEYNREDTNGTRTTIHEVYLQKYTDNMPPDSWNDPIEEDEYEPDNILTNASKIKIGRAQSHSFTVNDTDYCYFEAVEGQGYLIQGLSYVEIECALLDKNGNVIMTDSDNDLKIAGLGDEVETVIAWECPVSGKYYLMFKGEDSRGMFSSGFYQIKIDKCEIDELEFDADISVAKKIPTNNGSKFFKQINNTR